MTSTMRGTDRYTVISADGHAGADLLDYRAYLPSRWHDDFDAWAPTYVNPFADLLAPTAFRNWDSDRRLAELESNGVAAEVLFPNTVPPFFEQSNLTALPPMPRSTSGAGRGCRPITAGWSTSARRRRGDGPG